MKTSSLRSDPFIKVCLASIILLLVAILLKPEPRVSAAPAPQYLVISNSSVDQKDTDYINSMASKGWHLHSMGLGFILFER
jgi:hypothetical protein